MRNGGTLSGSISCLLACSPRCPTSLRSVDDAAQEPIDVFACGCLVAGQRETSLVAPMGERPKVRRFRFRAGERGGERLPRRQGTPLRRREDVCHERQPFHLRPGYPASELPSWRWCRDPRQTGNERAATQPATQPTPGAMLPRLAVERCSVTPMVAARAGRSRHSIPKQSLLHSALRYQLDQIL